MTSLPNSKVTFIVPCYKLAHFLSDCVESILSQSYGDFDVLIMDDCSPDNTSEVARSFRDPRVIHVRNETNLRHLANYNKGINLARGEYIWLISADDRLRSPYVLERYVTLMEKHPEVGYVFCPAMKLEGDKETKLHTHSFHGDQDRIFEGRMFLSKLLEANTVVAASAMARKDCYQKVSLFPLDLPYAGDWYLWCIFALHYDVAYLSEPMVNYRHHTQTMTNLLKNQDYDILFHDDVAVLTRIRDKACLTGLDSIMAECNKNLIKKYLRHLIFVDENSINSNVTIGEFESLMGQLELNKEEKDTLIGQIYTDLGDDYHWRGKTTQAIRCYRSALQRNGYLVEVWLKLIFLFTGRVGIHLRTGMSYIRRLVKQTKASA